MTPVLTQGLYAISLSYSLSILSGTSRLMLAQIAFVLLERASCWPHKRFFLYIAVDHGDMSWSHRPIFYYLVHLVDSVDHSMGHHSTQLRSMWASITWNNWPLWLIEISRLCESIVAVRVIRDHIFKRSDITQLFGPRNCIDFLKLLDGK